MSVATITKHDLDFLAEAMDRRRAAPPEFRAAAAPDKVGGDMSIPKPVTVDVSGTMSAEDYKKCSMIMAVCQNMVQKTITDAAKKAGVDITVALKSMEAWVRAYADFPLPVFNFIDTQSDVYNKDDFQLSVDPQVVEQIVNIKGVAGLKDAVIGALKASEGQLVSYKKENRQFNYFGVITAYNETNIATRVIKFAMNLQKTDVKVLCGGGAKTALHSSYDTYQFAGDKEMMIKLQGKFADKLVDYIAAKLYDFTTEFYDQELAKWADSIQGALKKA